MARIRTIKPEFWTDEELSSLSEPAMLMAAGLLNYSDDEGWFNANPLLIKAAIFPLREPSKTILGMLQELSGIGYIELFSGADGKKYGRVRNFSKHQRVDKPKKSEIKHLAIFDDKSKNDPGLIDAGKEGNGKEKEGKGNISPELQGISGPAFIKLTLNDKSEFEIFENQIAEWQELYPAVDIRQELRKMRGWCDANQTKRKTRRGILKFVTSWLAREQDKGGNQRGQNNAKSAKHDPWKQLENRQRPGGDLDVLSPGGAVHPQIHQRGDNSDGSGSDRK